MPGPLDLTGDDYKAHVKAQAVTRNRRYRERLRERRNALREQEALSGGAAHGSPPTPPVSPPLSLTEIERLLAPFASRGYVHSERFWHLAAAEYPRLNLELQAFKLAEWLEEPRNRKKLCNKRRIDNWLKIAERDGKAQEAAPAPSGAPKGVVVNGTWHPPAAFQRNPGPPPGEAVPLTGPLERIGEAELRAVRDANRHLTLAQKAARLTNGVHK